MAEELQQLLEKIQRDGVDRANAEADAIRAKAKADAAAIVKEATENAAAVSSKAEAEAAAFAERARTTIRQAARDTVLETQDAIRRIFEKLVSKDVAAALADTAVPLAKDAVAALVGGRDGAQVVVDPRLVEAVRAQMAGSVEVVGDGSVGAGFSVRMDGGRVEYDFSEKAVAAALARRLRPDLAALVDG